jgi:hypothetical protein
LVSYIGSLSIYEKSSPGFSNFNGSNQLLQVI